MQQFIFIKVVNLSQFVFLSPQFQIQNLKTSIQGLQAEVKTLVSGTFETFITDSVFDFGQYKKNTLPSTKQAVNVYILRDQEIILTKNFNTDSSMINMFFPGFTKIMLEEFGQNIVSTKQAYNQGLVLDKGLFKFVNINSTNLYEVKNTKDISQTFQLLSQLINQEQKFLNQLESFMQMKN